ncbi:hypothetical protein PIB30_068459 [Stylosanthes scabra]|uniref:DUF295 domain-containing protein n=1 Tax=Stylosanthes scabra TaxID=79078 RepID=A0ABU6WR75_9FABA|nr:hypothetical protein [Stylosanthes scabra]
MPEEEEEKEIRYVCFKTPDKVYGINLCDLLLPAKEEDAVVMSWDSLPPIPAAFKADLPAFYTSLVEVDSNFYLFGGFRLPQRGGSRNGSASLKVFQLELEEGKDESQKRLTCKGSSSIPKPPQPFGKLLSKCIEIRGDFYFIVFNCVVLVRAPTFSWVLRSSTWKLESLPTPPCLCIDDDDLVGTQYFVFEGKIYLQTIYAGKEESCASSGEAEKVLFVSHVARILKRG